MLAPDFMTCFSPAAALRLELVLSPAVFCLAWAWPGLAPRLLSAATLELVFSLSDDPPASDLVDTSLYHHTYQVSGDIVIRDNRYATHVDIY